MNLINPKKLLNSKWTALKPLNKEKHFVIICAKFDENQHVTKCVIEAVLSKRQRDIDWRELKDDLQWSQGWQ